MVRKLFLAIVLILLSTISLSARAKYQGIAGLGGKKIITSGISSTTLSEQTYPSCTITVYKAGTINLATLFSDNNGTPQANPFTVGADASYSFYSNNGRYDVRFSGGLIVTPFTLGDIVLSDLTEPYDVRNFGATCDGSILDTTAISDTIAAISGNGLMILPQGSPCLVSNLTIPSNVTIDYTKGGSWKIVTGQTLTILGSELGRHSLNTIYNNALAGQGTITYVGSKKTKIVYPENWGAIPDGTTVNNTQLQAAITAIASVGGTVEFSSGTYKLTTTINVGQTTGGGDGLGNFTTVHLKGVGGFGAVGSTVLSYEGATNIPFIKIMRGRFNHLEDLYIINTTGIRGTTVGVLETGPAISMQTHGVHYERVTITGFYKGIESGDATIGVFGSASEAILFEGGSLTNNTYGFFASSNFNSLNFTFVQAAFQGNDYGLYTTTGYRISIIGCAGGQNGVDFYVSGGGNTLNVDGWDGEQSMRFIRLGNNARATVNAAELRFYTLTRAEGTAAIESGISNISLNEVYMHVGNIPSAGATGPHFIYSTGGNIDVTGCTFPDDQLPHISNINSGSNLTSYRLFGNRSIDNTTGAVISRFPDQQGIILWSTGTQADKHSFTNLLGSGFAATTYSPAQITSNQNNYTLPMGAHDLYVRLSTDASRNITGFATASPTQVDGQTHYFLNTGTQDIVLTNQDVLSLAANRFLNTTGANITISANQQAMCVYDGTTTRWRCSKMN